MKKILQFYNFVYDRQMVWHNKSVLNLPKPWSEDKILNEFFFCNVYRELDKGTRYLIEKVIDNPKLRKEDKYFNIVAYRFFNWVGFFEEIFGEPNHSFLFDRLEIEAKMDGRKAGKGKLFHNAYTVTQMAFPTDKYPYPEKDYRKGVKHAQILLALEWLAQAISTDHYTDIRTAPTPEFAFDEIKAIPLVGPFLAYEIFCDLAYGNLIPFTDNDFVNIGPGAIWGLELIFDKKFSNKEAVKACEFLRDEQAMFFQQLKTETGKDWWKIAYPKAYTNTPYLSLRNIEHSLCEARKYWNVQRSQSDPEFRCKLRYY